MLLPPPDAPTTTRPGSIPDTGSAAAPAARPATLPPGSELRGLTTIETVVEDLSAQAATCGLDQRKIQTSIAKILADAGLLAAFVLTSSWLLRG